MLCPGLNRQSVNVGDACWKIIWKYVGCKEEKAPPYGSWQASMPMEGVVHDALLWANLPTGRHRQGCYGKLAVKSEVDTTQSDEQKRQEAVRRKMEDELPAAVRRLNP